MYLFFINWGALSCLVLLGSLCNFEFYGLFLLDLLQVTSPVPRRFAQDSRVGVMHRHSSVGSLGSNNCVSRVCCVCAPQFYMGTNGYRWVNKLWTVTYSRGYPKKLMYNMEKKPASKHILIKLAGFYNERYSVHSSHCVTKKYSILHCNYTGASCITRNVYICSSVLYTAFVYTFIIQTKTHDTFIYSSKHMCTIYVYL